MSGGLPASIDPVRLADQGTRLRGTIPLNRMKRLLTACRSQEGVAQVDLLFQRDRERELRTIAGTVEATVVTTCERCLEAMTLSLRADIDLLVTADENAGREDRLEEVLVAGTGPISLDELVENELILAMPMIPRHPPPACPASRQDADAGREADKASPFAALARLKNNDCDTS